MILPSTSALAASGFCGDGILQFGEDCDDGAKNGTAGSNCTASCTHLLLSCVNEESCGCFDAFQEADDVIGQAKSDMLQGNLPNNGGYGTNGSGLDRPQDIAIDTHFRLLYVADRLNNRVLVFRLDGSHVPLSSSADYVLGQPDFTSNAEGGGQFGMKLPTGVAVDALRHRVYVSDAGNNRVLVYENVSPQALSKGLLPSAVLGQKDFTVTTPETASARMSDPHGIVVNRYGDLYVADTGNNRVLRFTTEKGVASGQFAETVLGQRTFTGSLTGIGLDSLHAPRDIAIDPVSQTVFVADTGNNRVLVFHEKDIRVIVPGDDPNEAYRVLNTTKGADAKSFYGPASISVSMDQLFIADMLNSRVLLFSLQEALQSNINPSAVTLLGQERFGSNSPIAPPGLRYMMFPSAIDFSSGDCTLFVADTGNNRIVTFRPHHDVCVPPPSSMGAPVVTCNLNRICEPNYAGGGVEVCACEDCALNFCGAGTICDNNVNACVPVKTQPSSPLSWVPSLRRWISFLGSFLPRS